MLRAVAFSLVTLNLPANSCQSGCGSWHDVTDPSYTSYSRGPVFTTTLPSNRNGWPLSYTGRCPGLSPTEPFTSKKRPVCVLRFISPWLAEMYSLLPEFEAFRCPVAFRSPVSES